MGEHDIPLAALFVLKIMPSKWTICARRSAFGRVYAQLLYGVYPVQVRTPHMRFVRLSVVRHTLPPRCLTSTSCRPEGRIFEALHGILHAVQSPEEQKLRSEYHFLECMAYRYVTSYTVTDEP